MRRRTLVLAIFGGCLLALPLACRAFLFEPYRIPAGSMMPTLQVGDHVMVSKLSYSTREIERGDLIVFRYPLDEREDFVKRVIGLPGDEVIVETDGLQLRRAGETEASRVEQIPLDEPCVDDDGKRKVAGCALREEVMGERRYRVRYMSFDGQLDRVKTFTVPEGNLFVLGDNRNQSHDSSQWTTVGPDGDEIPMPFVPLDNVIGRVTMIWLPFARWGQVN